MLPTTVFNASLAKNCGEIEEKSRCQKGKMLQCSLLSQVLDMDNKTSKTLTKYNKMQWGKKVNKI